jgi:extracellular elastinolytic metalloproteinase
VLGEALDGAATLLFSNGSSTGLPDPNHTDNANMGTPPDGLSPRMQMFLWHDPFTDLALGIGTDPFLPADGSNEANIVYHEYTHGLSNRLVVDAAGNSTLGNIQAGSMGEAWSDWYAFDYLVKQGLVTDTAADGDIRLGVYVAKNQDLIRTQPMDCSVGSTSPACHGTAGAGPGGYTYGDFGKIIGRPEVHADGEIWASTLWDLRGALGSPTTEGLVTRAMELSPNNPSFLDMRNSILQADQVASGGANRDTIWAVFAKRGMGYFAAATDGDDAQPVENFALPPGPKAKTAKLKGTVVDSATGQPIGGAVVAFGGHASGFPGDFVGVAGGNGKYDIKKVFVGTYPKVFAQAPGYDRSVRTVAIGQGEHGGLVAAP